MKSAHQSNTGFPSTVHNVGRSNSSRRLFGRGHVLIAGLLAFTGLGVTTVYMTSMMQNPPAPEVQPASKLEVQGALVRAGLSPAALIAAGVEPNQLAGMFTRATNEMEDRVETLRIADAAREQKQRLVNTYQESFEAGQGSKELAQQLRTAQAELKSAQEQVDAVLTAVRTAAEATFTENQVQALAALRQNQRRELPIEYLVVERSDEDWVNLRDALSAKRIAERRDEEVPTEASAFLTQADADPAVAAAKVAMTNNTQAAEAIWRDAFIEAVEEQQGEE